MLESSRGIYERCEQHKIRGGGLLQPKFPFRERRGGKGGGYVAYATLSVGLAVFKGGHLVDNVYSLEGVATFLRMVIWLIIFTS